MYLTRRITSLDARKTLQCAIVATGGKVAFDFMFAKYNETSDSALRDEFLQALACATDAAILEEYVNI